MGLHFLHLQLQRGFTLTVRFSVLSTECACSVVCERWRSYRRFEDQQGLFGGRVFGRGVVSEDCLESGVVWWRWRVFCLERFAWVCSWFLGAMAAWWRGLTFLLVVLCSVSLSTASDVDALRGLNQDFSSRKLLQAVPPTPHVAPPTPVPVAPVPATGPVKGPATGPVKGPAPAPSSPVRTYSMWIGIGASCLVLVSVAVFCLCRKFGQQKVRGAQRLPPLPRYH